MPITRTPMIDDDGTGTTGTIINNAWKQEFYNQIDGLVPGWVDVPFAAANFAATSPMIWTVGAAAVRRNRYSLHGKTLFWSMYLSWFSGSNVLSGTPSPSLVLTVPGGLSVAAFQEQLTAFSAGITGGSGVAQLHIASDAAGPTVTVYKGAGGNFALADIPGMIFTMTLEVL